MKKLSLVWRLPAAILLFGGALFCVAVWSLTAWRWERPRQGAWWCGCKGAELIGMPVSVG